LKNLVGGEEKTLVFRPNTDDTAQKKSELLIKQ
jgi:hypothetical protein